MRILVPVMLSTLVTAACAGAAVAGLRPTEKPTNADNARAHRLLPTAKDLPGFDARSTSSDAGPSLRECASLGFTPDVGRLTQTGAASSPIWVQHEPLGGKVLSGVVVIPDVRVMRSEADAEAYFRRVYASRLVGRCIAATVRARRFDVTSVARRRVAGGAPREAAWRIAYETPLKGPLKPVRYTLDYSFQGRGRANVALVIVGTQGDVKAAAAIGSRLQKATATRLAHVFP
jgi:hypothetical protein